MVMQIGKILVKFDKLWRAKKLMGENLKVVGVVWIFIFLPKVVNLAQKNSFLWHFHTNW